MITIRKLTLLATVLVTTTILVTGCDVLRDNDKPTTQQETEEAARKLQSRPTLEEAEAQMQQVMEQIASAATELVPNMRFEWTRDRSTPDCAQPFDRTYGRQVYLRNLVSPEPFPEDKWPTFMARAKELAATVGATWSQQIVEEPSGTTETSPSSPGAAPQYGDHDVNFYNSDTGDTVRVGTSKATVIAATVGCHLPKDKFDNPIRPTS